MKKVLIATEKPFSKQASDGIKALLQEKGHEVRTLEKYTDVNQLYEAVADVKHESRPADVIMSEMGFGGNE